MLVTLHSVLCVGLVTWFVCAKLQIWLGQLTKCSILPVYPSAAVVKYKGVRYISRNCIYKNVRVQARPVACVFRVSEWQTPCCKRLPWKFFTSISRSCYWHVTYMQMHARTCAHTCTQILMEMVYFAHRPGTAHRQPCLTSLSFYCVTLRKREKRVQVLWGWVKRYFEAHV
jgi:hypothetical protein